VRTLKIMALMEPIPRVYSGLWALNLPENKSKRSLVAALCRDDN
jgi:hypothetical protein